MNRTYSITIVILALNTINADAFDSGSTGTEAFTPTVDEVVQLPENGLLQYTEVDIPAGVTITFAKNNKNTPVTILASGHVTINGTISVNGGAGGDRGNGTPGVGGPGGFDGGHGAHLDAANRTNRGGDGFGPGGGGAGHPCGTNIYGIAVCYGGGGGFANTGESISAPNGSPGGAGGLTYGNQYLLPLIGGSGGGGAGIRPSSTQIGTGGGGGGGALLIAASGTITIEGTLSALGGNGQSDNSQVGRSGSGSGGAIRLVATKIQGNGTITAAANTAAVKSSHGRIRLEAEEFLRTATTTPPFIRSTPGPLFISRLPSLRITDVGGTPVPVMPTGHRDVILPGITMNPITVALETNFIPVGTLITVKATPAHGELSTSASSTGVVGSTAAGTDAVSLHLPNGHSILTAQATFDLTVSSAGLEKDYSRYAQGQPVERVRVAVNEVGQSITTFITANGEAHTWPSHVVAFNP